ncbi:protease B nonderepressible form [Entomophthora muscae]|uniref:Protease B nonderepressible form n=1 Tax=Entomophthora muscae TaxID=34485 RepID=A0ACC2RXE0_9FUNG|nr:protease B nonderepressible form [Entomophthora muscae]
MRHALPLITITTELDPAIGFHPKIYYKFQVKQLKKEYIVLNNNYDISSNSLHHDVPISTCLGKTESTRSILIISQVLPADTFIDPYQLENLISFRESSFKKERLFPVLESTQIELELPVYEVPSSLENKIHIFWDLEASLTNVANFTLPFHMRYRKPFAGLKQIINIPPPSLRVGCFKESEVVFSAMNEFVASNKPIHTLPFMLKSSYHSSDNTNILFISETDQSSNISLLLPPEKSLPLLPLEIEIPSGNPAHQAYVVILTLVLILTGLGYLFTRLKKFAPKLKFATPPASPTSSFVVKKPSLVFQDPNELELNRSKEKTAGAK